MKNYALTAIVACADETTARQINNQLHTANICSSRIGRIVRVAKKFQVVGELSDTAPEKARKNALFQTLIEEINAEDEFRSILDTLSAPYLILEEIEAEQNTSIQEIAFSCGVESLFFSVSQLYELRSRLLDMSLERPDEEKNSKKRDLLVQYAGSLNIVISFAKKTLVWALQNGAQRDNTAAD